MTDIAGPDSSIEAQGWAGAQRASVGHSCLSVELLKSGDPGSYQAGLELLAGRDDLVIAGSFLQADAVLAAASDLPAHRFVLVDPLLTPAPRSNLAVIDFREDQAGFLAGALAAMVSRSRAIGGVYGPESAAISRYRRGFELGAASIDPAITILGAYQPVTSGRPFGNSQWGRQQADAWLKRGVDVIFGAGGTTGDGALLAAAQAQRFCVGAGGDAFLTTPAAQNCLVSSAVVYPDRAVEAEIIAAAHGRWSGGQVTFGLEDDAVGLAPFHEFDSYVTRAMRTRLAALQERLAAGQFLEGN